MVVLQLLVGVRPAELISVARGVQHGSRDCVIISLTSYLLLKNTITTRHSVLFECMVQVFFFLNAPPSTVMSCPVTKPALMR